MKRFLTAFLCLALAAGLFAVPVHAEDAEAAVIDSPDSVFPSDTILQDLILEGECPRTVILINVDIQGTLRIDVDHPITVRMQGTSSCENAEISSSAILHGGSFGSIVSDTGIVYLEKSSAESVTLKKTGGQFISDCELGKVTMDGRNGLLGGKHHASSLTVNQPFCTWGGTYDSVEKDFTEEERAGGPWNNRGVEAELVLERDYVSPADNNIRGTITLTRVPEEMEGDYRIYWYVGDQYVSGTYHMDVREGATASFECSPHFWKVMPEYLPVWAEITNNYDEDLQLRFMVPVQVRDYSTSEYRDIEFDSDVFPYEIHLLRDQNTILVYGLDDQGKYTKLVNVFVCSVGLYSPTPLGNFEVNYKARWGELNGDVWGQYASQFNGNMLFHSVPYRSDRNFDIEFEEYNLLGTPASSGCVRMSTLDAMWIYDHCRKGTKVMITDSGSCPVDKPIPVHINEDGRLRGWDPTDPSDENPTRSKNPPIVHIMQGKISLAHRPDPLFQ